LFDYITIITNYSAFVKRVVKDFLGVVVVPVATTLFGFPLVVALSAVVIVPILVVDRLLFAILAPLLFGVIQLTLVSLGTQLFVIKVFGIAVVAL
jgi:hypothetical protein